MSRCGANQQHINPRYLANNGVSGLSNEPVYVIGYADVLAVIGIDIVVTTNVAVRQVRL